MKFYLLGALLLLTLYGAYFYRDRLAVILLPGLEPELPGTPGFTDIILKEGQTLIFDNLSINNKGGGHKSMWDMNTNQGAGDLSFAELQFSDGSHSELVRVMQPMNSEKEKYTWNNFQFYVKEVGWDGEFVILQLEKPSTQLLYE